MAKKAVIGAIMHKLAHLIYGVIHTDKPFDAHYWAKGLAIQDGIWPLHLHYRCGGVSTLAIAFGKVSG